MIETNLRDQSLETFPPFRVGAGAAQIIVDDQHPVGGPAHPLSIIFQPILQPRRFPMVQHLLGGGLPDVDYRQTVEMRLCNLARLRGLVVEPLIRIHGFSPWPPSWSV